jgi:hypothetical protein
MPPKAPTKDDRKHRLALASKYFAFLEEANELEDKAILLRARARRLREANPILARMDNLVDNFDRPKRKGKEPAAEERPSKKHLRTGAPIVRGSQQPTQEKIPPKVVATPTVHYHENDEGDKIPCTEAHRPE